MRNKMIAMVLTCLVSFHSFASTVDPSVINRIVDEYQYELTVNWDQKDQQQLLSINEKYLDLFEKLRIQGLDYNQLYTVLEPRISPHHRGLILNQINVLQLGLVSEDEALQSILEGVNSSRAQGAAWNGGVVEVVGIILSAALIIFLGSVLVEVISTISKCGTNPKYCCDNYGWVDTNGNGYCDSSEEVEKYK